MARVRSTARVEREGGEVEGAETVPISEAMRRSGLVTSEGISTAETEQTVADTEQVASEAEEGDIEEGDSDDDYHIAVPSKPNHLDFGKSTVSVTPGFRRQTECEPCTCQDQLFTYTAVT
jgi:hypothetical protein